MIDNLHSDQAFILCQTPNVSGLVWRRFAPRAA